MSGEFFNRGLEGLGLVLQALGSLLEIRREAE
jgi:hypothetical protein